MTIRSLVAAAFSPRSLLSVRGLKDHLEDSLFRNAYALMLNQAVASAFGFLFWMVAARSFSAEEVGLASAAVSAVGLVSSLANAGLGYGIIRYMPSLDERERSRLVSSSYVFTAASGALLAGAYLLGLRRWSPGLLFLLAGPDRVLGFVAFVVLACWSALGDNAFVAQRSAHLALYKNAPGNAFKVVLLLAVAGLNLGAFGLLSCFGSSYLVATLAAFYLLPKASDAPVRLRLTRPSLPGEVLRYSLSTYASGLLQSASTMVIPIIVVNVLGGEANAYFYVAWGMVWLLLVVPSALSTSFFAEGSHSPSSLGGQAIKSFGQSIFLLVIGIAGLVALGRVFLGFFGPGYARHGYSILCVLAAGSLPHAAILPYLTVLRIRKRLRALLFVSALTFVSSFTLCYAGAVIFGLVGVAAGWVLSQAVVAALVAAMVSGPGLLRRVLRGRAGNTMRGDA